MINNNTNDIKAILEKIGICFYCRKCKRFVLAKELSVSVSTGISGGHYRISGVCNFCSSKVSRNITYDAARRLNLPIVRKRGRYDRV